MSEEEAIKEIENYLDYECSVSIQAIATLYTAYNKEKEKNKELKEKAKNTMALIGANYIHKDKVKEKIEELDSIYQQEIKQKYNGRYYHQLSYAIQILKELEE